MWIHLHYLASHSSVGNRHLVKVVKSHFGPTIKNCVQNLTVLTFLSKVEKLLISDQIENTFWD